MKADLYISATTIDNFGTAVVEAAAHGLPIVATRVGFPAVLVEDGQTGFLVEPDDEEALYRAVREMVGDPEKRLSMGVRMRKRIEEMGLDWSSCAGRMSRIYRECLAQRSFR